MSLQNEAVILAKYCMVTILTMQIYECSAWKRIHAVEADTWLHFTNLQQNVLQAPRSLS